MSTWLVPEVDLLTKGCSTISFEMTPENAKRIAAVLSSDVAKRVSFLLYQEALKGKDEEGKTKGLTFNDLCRNISASRTTVHKVLAQFVVRDKIVLNSEGYVETPMGNRLATIYRLRPELMPIVEFLRPSLLIE